MVVTGWRAAVALLIVLAVVVLLVAIALWVAIALGVIAAVLWLNLVLLPRLARRLHMPGLALELICLPLLGGAGWLLGGPTWAALAALTWLAGIGLPRLAGRRLRARMRSAAQRPGTVIVVETAALPVRTARRS
jgi:hypothetical protein